MTRLLDGLAKWWLTLRGGVVLEPGWMGIAVGHCYVVQQGELYTVMPLSYPTKVIALTQSIVKVEDRP